MRVTGPLESLARGSFKTSGAASRAIEKSSASSQLGAGTQDLPQNKHDTSPRLQVELVCQDGTQPFDPFWDGPRLVPSFVAQLLGQVMPERRDAKALAHTAYGSAAPRKALLVDRRS